MSLKSVLLQFGHWFIGLFQSIDTAWQQEEPVLQGQLISASQFVQTVKTNLDKTPAEVWQLLNETGLSENIVINNLQVAANGLDSSIKIITGDPIQTLSNLMDFIRPLTGNNWADKMQSFFKLVAAELSPGTAFEKISLFAQYVYMNFVQPHTD